MTPIAMGVWRFHPSNLTLTGPWDYEIDLETCRSSAEVLDWIVQVSHKTWAGPNVIADLVLALDALLHLQGSMCSLGVDQRIHPKAIIAMYARSEMPRYQK
jgi:hypothetical protein